ncbi:UDP-N-acetylmuramoyl-tripeptide--D-alanyl-D-alanine ligase [Legionella sp. CNM-4043-24]|uniref:UDP-N-acetylmuramoyl-tripeptide--D-alanyl-D- alanine ligase n=1 Tax=Legionella sp. CNM-4043-24 TaxID=3421646 RepID=UPI00403A91C2
MNLKDISVQLGLEQTAPLSISGVSIDSRTIEPGMLFVALRGEQFDGHDFISAAVSRGAAAVLCECRQDNLGDIPQLVVPDSLQALASLATQHRKSLSCPVIALTGSNGKTSVKEMIAAILPEPSFATPGNLNNHIGAPLSVLQLESRHRYAVFELGASRMGDVAFTVAIAQPQIALINNIAPAHIEGFGSIDGVANAKGEIYQGLPENGTAIVNDDDDYAHYWDALLRDKRVLRFSLNKAVDVYARSLELDERDCARFTLVLPSGEAAVHLAVPGIHSARNALAASACCYAAGVSLADIVKGLQGFRGVAGRMTCLQGKKHAQIIDDSYNANLRSVLTAVEVLAKRKGRRILVLGDMGELGQWTQSHHEEIGRVAKSSGIDRLMTCGNHSEHSTKAFGEGATHYRQQDDLARDLLPLLDENTSVLVKGSRSAAMEKVVRQLVD